MKPFNIFILGLSFKAVVFYSKDQGTNTSVFKLCGNGITYPYYEPELKYRGGFGEIKMHFFKNYNKPVNFLFANNSGIVKIAFAVNCKGETGNYVIETCDFDYRPIEFSLVIKNQLLQITQSLKDWIPAKDKNNNTINSHKFFAFKIENGKLIEILPK